MPPSKILLAPLPVLLAVWATVSIVTALFYGNYRPELFQPALGIAIASGVISVAAVLPGLIMCQWMASKCSSSMLVIQAGMWAMGIRVLGTVALTALCHYHMGETTRELVVLIGGFYFLLTTAEVAIIARRTSLICQLSVPRQDQSTTITAT